jgi:hypothetical protein
MKSRSGRLSSEIRFYFELAHHERLSRENASKIAGLARSHVSAIDPKINGLFSMVEIFARGLHLVGWCEPQVLVEALLGLTAGG